MGDSPNRAARSLGLRVGSRPLGLGHVGGRPAGSEYLGQHVPRVTPGTRARTQAIQASPPALGLHGVGHVGGWPVASPCPTRTQGFPWDERVELQLAGVTSSPGPAWDGKDYLLLLANAQRSQFTVTVHVEDAQVHVTRRTSSSAAVRTDYTSSAHIHTRPQHSSLGAIRSG